MMTVISGAPSNFVNRWCVYSQRTPGAVVYVGYCQATKLLQFPDARKNKTWLNLCQHDPLLITVVDGFFDDQEQAGAAAAYLVRTHNPVCNRDAASRAAQRPARLGGAVICNETGEAYASAAAAARAIGANAAAMSQHLAGAVGYRTIRGLTFRRE